MTFKAPNRFRIRTGNFATDDSYGCNGVFFFPNKTPTVDPRNFPLRVIASDGEGWEHVSVSLVDRTPTWEEMDYIKRQFWDDEDCVMQLHPPRSQWVNAHPYCLHLWRPIAAVIPQPSSWLVGPRDKEST